MAHSSTDPGSAETVTPTATMALTTVTAAATSSPSAAQTQTATATSTPSVTQTQAAAVTSTPTAAPTVKASPAGAATPQQSSSNAVQLSPSEMRSYTERIRRDPSICIGATGDLKFVCEMDTGGPSSGDQGHGAPPPPAKNSNDETARALVDPDNPPKVATSNFVDLDPYIAISKIRSAYGHNYSAGDPEYDPSGRSCRSMKHYFDAYTFEQRWSGNFGAYDTRGNVKFYAPADGTLMDIKPQPSDIGIEYQFTIMSSESSRISFVFHHVDLLENLQSGGPVTSGQHLGYIARFNGQAEIVTYVSTGMGTAEYISFFDVMSDEVFAEYQARGIVSRSQMTIPQAQRDANPIACTLDDGKGGKFVATGDAEEFDRWQFGSDNWVSMKK